ncbi:MAG: hypothetical protein RMJ75_03970 [Nitrososphaerota archaeon]|nr:hypothetical protein [Nitrososphaerota archaeon]
MSLGDLLERCGLSAVGLGGTTVERIRALNVTFSPVEGELGVPDELRKPALSVIARQALIELHSVVLALASDNEDIAEIDAGHSTALVGAVGVEEFNMQVVRLGGSWSVGPGVLTTVLLVLSKLASLQASSILEESGVRFELVSRIAREDGESLERLRTRADRSLVGSASTELLERLQGTGGLMARWYMTDEEASREVSILLGGGKSAESVELGAGRFNSIQEEYHLKRVNALRSMGFDLLMAQKVAELPGGTVKAGWGC